MTQRWEERPAGSNWGEFGPDDQLGQLNYLTPETTVKAAQEIREGIRFCLSLPLDIPATNATNLRRHPPEFKPITRDGAVAFNLPLGNATPGRTDVNSDEAVLIHTQHSTQWDAFGHMGSMFDADGDGEREPIQYNGHSVMGVGGKARYGDVGAWNLGIEHMARHCVQGRGVLVDLKRRFGEECRPVGHTDLMQILEEDGVTVEQGDILCVYTGYADKLIELGADIPADLPRRHCPALDGQDNALLEWIAATGMAALTCDNRAVEFEHEGLAEGVTCGPGLPLHELCLFKRGIHLGEMWYFAEIAAWLHANGRNRFFLTAPPLHLPGAVGSPANPIGTV